MVTSVSINQGGRFGKHSQRLGERKVQAELTEKQMQVSILEELLAAVDFAVVVYGSRFGFHDTRKWRSSQFPTHESPFGGFRKWWYPQIIHFNRVFH